MEAVPEAMSTTQAAALLRVNRDTVRRWIADGKLPAFRVGSRWRVRSEDIGRMVADVETRTAA